jgi:hypothetical protein
VGQIAAKYCRLLTNDQYCARQETDLIAFAVKAGYEEAGAWEETTSGRRIPSNVNCIRYLLCTTVYLYWIFPSLRGF